MGKLITPSILSAMDFAKNARGKWAESGKASLIKQLSRIYDKEMPAPVRRGIDFENRVYQCARKSPETWSASKEFSQIVDRVRGGEFQAKAKRDLEVDGVSYTCYGKLDVLLPDEIVDIKTTNKYRPPGHYLKTAQHLIYTWAKHIPDFVYLVIVMDDNDKIIEVYEIDFTSPGEVEVENQLIRTIRGFREDLEIMGLTDLYLSKFCLY